MPMRWKRVKYFIKTGKGVLVKTKYLGVYLKLKVDPGSYNTQDVVLGIDPGTKFNGFSIVTKKVHNLNIQRNSERVNHIKNNMKNRVTYRRDRRSRLRHRKVRFSSRTKSKTSKTIHYLTQVKIQMIKDVIKVYPISKIVIEDVKFNHYISKIGSSFSQVEQGKNIIRKYINKLGIPYRESDGRTTKFNRLRYFSMVDPKDQEKGNDNFYTHCVDSYVLAQSEFLTKVKYLNLKYISIKEPSLSKRYSRRTLREFSGKAKGCKIPYFRLGKKGNWIVFTKKHKLKKVRTKLDQFQGNHGPWNYHYLNLGNYLRRGFLYLNGSKGKKNKLKLIVKYNGI
jgi:hypothetical protein